MKPLKYFVSLPQFIIWLFNGLWSQCIAGVTGEGNVCLKHPVLKNCFQWKIVAGNAEASFKSALGTRGPHHPLFITHLCIFLFMLSSSFRFCPFNSYIFIESDSQVLWGIVLKSLTPTVALLFLLATSRNWQQSNLDETIVYSYALLDSLMQEGNSNSHCGNSMDLSNSQWRDFKA